MKLLIQAITILLFITGCASSRTAVDMKLTFEESKVAVLEQNIVQIEFDDFVDPVRAQVIDMNREMITFRRKKIARSAWAEESMPMTSVKRIYKTTKTKRIIGVTIGVIPGILWFASIDNQFTNAGEKIDTGTTQAVAIGAAVLGGAIGGTIGSSAEKEKVFYHRD